MLYLVGRKGKELEFAEKRDSESQLAIETLDGKVYPCALYDIIKLSDEIVTVDNISVRIDTLKYLTLEEAMERIGTVEDDFMIKDIDGKLPDPYKEDIPPFTSAVVMAITKDAVPHALSRSQHKKKLTIIRNINELTAAGKGNELTIGKACELLSYYGMKLEDILKPEYVVNRK